jgi:hypothetical protein
MIDLNRYKQKYRLIILFSPSPDNEQYQSFKAQIPNQRDEIIDRDILIFHIFETGKSRTGESFIDSNSADSLRNRFSIRPGGFTVILIGKDGDEKWRRESLAELGEILALIDSMPMRQMEMRKRG